MDYLTQLFLQFTTYSKSNPVVAGAVSLWGLAVISWFGRNLPLRLVNFIRHQFTTSLTLINDGRGNVEETFASFHAWFTHNKLSRWSRTYTVTGAANLGSRELTAVGDTGKVNLNEDVVGIGLGTHLFFWKRRFYWLHCVKLGSENSYRLRYEITINTFGRRVQPLRDMYEAFRFRRDPEQLGIYQATMQGEWSRRCDIAARPLNTVIVNAAIKRELLTLLDDFYTHPQFYRDRGLPHKKTIGLHGIPGTGKTSLIKALATHYKRNIYQINIHNESDASLEQLLSQVEKNSFVLIEDIDSSAAAHQRDGTSSVRQLKPTPEPMGDAPAAAAGKPKSNHHGGSVKMEMFSSVTTTGLLNALGGIIPLDGIVIFITTNAYHLLDEALTRRGRIDKDFELGPLEDAEIREYLRLMWPEEDQSDLPTFGSILGCDLEALYFDYHQDFARFVAVLPLASTLTHLGKPFKWTRSNAECDRGFVAQDLGPAPAALKEI